MLSPCSFPPSSTRGGSRRRGVSSRRRTVSLTSGSGSLGSARLSIASAAATTAAAAEATPVSELLPGVYASVERLCNFGFWEAYVKGARRTIRALNCGQETEFINKGVLARGRSSSKV